MRTGVACSPCAALARSRVPAREADAGDVSGGLRLTRARFAVEYLGICHGARAIRAHVGHDRRGRAAEGRAASTRHRHRSVDMGWDLRDAFLRSEVMFDDAAISPACVSDRRSLLRGRTARRRRRRHDAARRDAPGAARRDSRRMRQSVADDGREACGATVTGRISRRAFGMDFAYPLIGDEVELEFEVTAFRVADAAAASAARPSVPGRRPVPSAPSARGAPASASPPRPAPA